MTSQREPIVPGSRHGKITIIARDPSGTYKHPRYKVRCDCGRENVIGGANFRQVQSCRSCAKLGQPRKYGDRIVVNNELYRRWVAMRHRCRPTDKNDKNIRWYGRGIKVCDEWENSFEVFEKWALANGYRLGLSIDRVDNDGNYEPSNCEWVTRSVNSIRVRKLYVNVSKASLPCFYDEVCYGDF